MILGLFLKTFILIQGTSFGQVSQETNEHLCENENFDCVPYYQCKNGMINTDGEELINLRILPPGNCIIPNNPDMIAVCCLKPENKCYGIDECVDKSLCSPYGFIITDGTGLIDPRSVTTTCLQLNGKSGVCCTPPPSILDHCPMNSVCLSSNECIGKALDYYGNFEDYKPPGLWTECKIDIEKLGICCDQSSEEYVNKCGIRNYDTERRIQSNRERNEASFGEFPWQAIIFYQNYTYLCGATLITKNHVITAAHCVYKTKPQDICIRLGEWQVNSFNERLAYKDYDVEVIYIHPDFILRNLYSDIAILVLNKSVKFQYHINTVCVPSIGQKFSHGDICVISGWGKDSFKGRYQSILKTISLPLLDHNYCQNLLRKTRLGPHFRLHYTFCCAGGEANVDTCKGDGGGPLVCQDSYTGQYYLVGITSWGIGCGIKDVPGVYVHVGRFSDWIDEIILQFKTKLPLEINEN